MVVGLLSSCRLIIGFFGLGIWFDVVLGWLLVVGCGVVVLVLKISFLLLVLFGVGFWRFGSTVVWLSSCLFLYLMSVV